VKRILLTLLVVSIFAAISTPAYASLSVFRTFTGSVGYSTDGFGSTTQSGTISASVPVGATVLNAYLYTSTFLGVAGIGGTLNGTAVTYATLLGANNTGLQAARADVTNIVIAAVGGGSAVPINFTVTETQFTQDGEALVVVYSLPSLPTSTVAILDGFSLTTGDTATLSFASALHPGAPGFSAELAIGDGFSCGLAGGCLSNQSSTLTVNGTQITTNAGSNDDSADGVSAANGNLITVGGFDDPFSPLLPSYAADHEKYNLIPQIVDGSTSITVSTLNPSNDDNIFLEVFKVSGTATVSTGVPEPNSMLLLGAGLIGLAGLGRRKFRGLIQKN